MQMNYAIAYLGGILIFSTLYWYIYGRKFYTGPIVEADVHEEGRSSDDEVAAKSAKVQGDVNV